MRRLIQAQDILLLAAVTGMVSVTVRVGWDIGGWLCTIFRSI
jgi:hypothetical protein